MFLSVNDREVTCEDGEGPAAFELPLSPEELVDLSPAGLAVLGGDYELLWHNKSFSAFLPDLRVGMSLPEELGQVIRAEKLDRLFFKAEKIVIPADHCGTEGDLMAVIDPGGWTPGEGRHMFYVWQADLLSEDYSRQMKFLVSVSHELRSPLAAITGFTEVIALEKERLSETQVEALEMIEVCSRYLEDLVEDLLDLTLNAFGELELSLNPIDLKMTVEETVGALRPRIEKKGQALALGIEADLPEIEADPLRMRQIIDNLVRNAHRHCPSGTAIEVKLQREGDRLCLIVEDDGPGIGFENPVDAFRSFRRAEIRDPDEMSGAGIGLTLTARLVELHRGEIELDTGPGEGTTFRVLLPINRETARPNYEPSFP